MKYSLALLFLISSMSFADNYLCVADASTGFKYDVRSKTWISVNFNVKDSKYIISKSDLAAYKYEVKRVGEKMPDGFCKNSFNKPGFLFCEGLGTTFRFNNKSGRYIRSYIAGYFNVVPEINSITDSNSDTPLIEIGKCSSF